MKQILHIFTKDVRRFWPEILISLAILAAFVFLCPYQWMNASDENATLFKSLSNLLAFLVPVSWWVLISRAVHAERMVGDTQFWITRPYAWKNLLAAKLLFLVAFLYLPYFLAQSVLLGEAGFLARSSFPGLFFNLLLITALLALPLTALAAVTSNFARLTLTILGIFLAFIAFLAVSTLVLANGSGSGTMNSPLSDSLCFEIGLLGLCVAIVLQYALRRVWLSRTVLIALPVLLCAVSFFASKYDQARMDHTYPPATGAPAQLSYNPKPQTRGTSTFLVSSHTMIPVGIPLAVSGVAEGYAVLTDGIHAEIKAPDGSHWTSAWQPAGEYRFLSGEVRPTVNFWMPLAVYKKFQSVPLDVHLSFALTQARAVKVTSIPLPLRNFAVPDFGACSPQMGWMAPLGEITGISCISPLRQPQLTYISTHWSDAPCSAVQTAPDPGVTGTAWVGSLDREPAQFGISSVVEPRVNLSNGNLADHSGTKSRSLCPGTLITFTQYDTVGRTQTSVSVQNFQLPKMTIMGNQISIVQ